MVEDVEAYEIAQAARNLNPFPPHLKFLFMNLLVAVLKFIYEKLFQSGN